jgi:hypothetical protein
MNVREANNWRRQCGAAWHACERRAAQSPLKFALFAVLLLQTFVLVVFQPSYETNDDVFMTMIASGQGFCPAPDEHLLFTNVVVGHALKRLYSAWPGMPWYGCYLLTIHYLAQVALLYCALTAGIWSPGDAKHAVRATDSSPPTNASPHSTRLRFTLYLIYFAIVELPMLNALQFTATAFLAAQAGLFLLWLAARRRQTQPQASVSGPISAAAALLIVAGLVRVESLLMAVLVTGPLGLTLVRQSWRRTLLPSAGAAALAAMLILLAANYDRRSYEQDPQWSDFFGYNELRVKFNDYQWTSYTPQTAAVFSAVNWSANDHEMIARWFFDDPAVFSEANLRAIVTKYPWKSARLTLSYGWQAIRKTFGDRSVCAVLLVLPFFLVSGDRERRARWAVLGCAGMALTLVVLLTCNTKLLPPRIYFPLLSFPLAVALLFPARIASTSGISETAVPNPLGLLASLRDLAAWHAQSRGARAILVMLVVGLAVGSYRQVRRSVRVQHERHALQAFLEQQRPFGRNLVVCWGPALPFELLSPLDNLSSWSGLPLVNLVWTQRTPWQESTKARFGISSLPEAIYQRDDVVLVANRADLALYETFAKEHFGADVQFVPSGPATDRFVAGRFRQPAGDGESSSTGVARSPADALER